MSEVYLMICWFSNPLILEHPYLRAPLFGTLIFFLTILVLIDWRVGDPTGEENGPGRVLLDEEEERPIAVEARRDGPHGERQGRGSRGFRADLCSIKNEGQCYLHFIFKVCSIHKNPFFCYREYFNLMFDQKLIELPITN